MGFGKSTLYSILPPGTRYRELWLPELINNHATLPSSIAGGHPLTLTGARKGTTADGVHFNGSATSNINCGVIHNAAGKLWLSFRFKLDQPHATGLGEKFLWGKWQGVNDYIFLRLETLDGRLRFRMMTAATTRFDFYAQDGAADITSWEAGRWYHVLASISTVNAVRLIVDNGTVVTNPSVAGGPAGGSFIIGDWRDPGLGDAFIGVITDFVDGTDDLTPAEETDLYNGIPPADAVNFWPLDEGRGVTAHDRGSGGNNGTLDTSCTWAYGQVEQPILSLDGINDRAGQGNTYVVDITGDLTLVWVGKMKSTYDGLTAAHYLWHFEINGNNLILARYDSGLNQWRFYGHGSGVPVFMDFTLVPAIDDYWIVIYTLKVTGQEAVFIQGNLIDSDIGVGVIGGGLARWNIGAISGAGGANPDISNPLFVGLIDGAFTERQARIFSKNLNSMLGLGLAI